MSVAETPAGAAQYAHEYVVESDLVGNVIDSAGEYDAKTDSEETTSLAAHIINAMTVGVNTFVYNTVSSGHDIEDLEEEVAVLAVALALHDTNKYVREAYGVETDGNTREAFDVYFENGDDFGVEEFLGEGYREDLLYLVQRTEVTEDGRETRGSGTGFVGLERYCRIGDQIASVVLAEGVERGYEVLSKQFDVDEVHLLRFNAVEQPILNDELLGATKEAIAGEDGSDEYGVVIGSTPDRVLYLGDDADRDRLRERVESQVGYQLIEGNRYQFSCKLGWNTFDYDVLAEFALDPETKESIIADEFRNLLSDGPAGVEGFERIPEEFDPYFSILAKMIYLDGRSSFTDEEIQEAYDRILDEQNPQTVKIHFVAYLVNHFEQHREYLDQLREELRPELHDDLQPETDAVGSVVRRFFEVEMKPDLPSKEDMCFLCGRRANTLYQKGPSAVYRTQEYSRRVPPHEKYKSICEVCNLEYALLADICDRHDVQLHKKVGVAYFHFDEFLGDIRLRGGRMGIQQGEIPDLAQTEVTTSLVRPQYYIQPFNFGNLRGTSDKNHRMVVVRQLLQASQAAGMKVVLGRPFTRFTSTDGVFVDEQAIRQQELLGLDRIERFGPLPGFVDNENATQSHLRRALSLCKIISMVGQDAGMNNPYLQLDGDTYHHLTDFAVRNHEYATRLSELETYVERYHTEQFMDMKTVAQRGIDLFGEQYDSKYKKTKIFREAIDAFLSGMNQGMDEEDLHEYVAAQVYDAADREDYAGYATTEQASEFVDAIRSYLVDNDLYTLKKLSDWENALVNSYLYAYEQVLHEDFEDDEPTNS